MQRLWRRSRHAAVYCPRSLGNIHEQFSEVHVLCDLRPLRPLASWSANNGAENLWEARNQNISWSLRFVCIGYAFSNQQRVYTLTWPSSDYTEFQGQSEVKISGLSYFFPKASPWEYPWLSRILRWLADFHTEAPHSSASPPQFFGVLSSPTLPPFLPLSLPPSIPPFLSVCGIRCQQLVF